MARLTKSAKLQKRKENPQEWTKKKIGIVVYTIIMVIYGFYTMILSIIAYAQFSGVIEQYGQIVANLEQSPIVDIQATTSQCSNDYESLFLYNFEGTYDGCDCNGVSSTILNQYDLSAKLYKGECDKNQTDATCDKVPPIDAKEMELYYINDVAQNVCVKRSKEVFYKDAPLEAKCDSGKVECGNKEENPNSLYCADSLNDCPIYSFALSAPGDISLTDYEELELSFFGTRTYNLYYSRKGTEQPISELRVTEGTGVCQKNNTQPNIESGHNEYILMSSERTTCQTDSRFDRYTDPAKNSEYDFFEANDLAFELESLPELTLETNDYFYNAYFRKFLKWNIDDRDLLKDVVSRKDKVDTMSNSQLFVMIINIIVCIVVSIILTISQVYNLCGKDVPCIEGDGEAEQQRIKRIKKICNYGAKCLQLPFVLWALILSASNRNFFNDVAESEASDGTTNKDMGELATLIEDQVYWKNIQMIVAFVIIVLIDIALYAKKKCTKKSGDKDKDKVQQIQPHQEVEQDSPEKKRPGQQQHFPTPMDPNQTQNYSSNNMMFPSNQAQQPPQSMFSQQQNQNQDPFQQNIVMQPPPQDHVQQPPQ